MTEQSIEKRLEAWGAWSRRSGVDLGAKSPMGHLIGPTGPSRSINITDEEALVVDRAVCLLQRKNEEMAKMVFLSYMVMMPQRRIAIKMKCSRARVTALLGRAVGWIDGALSGVEEGV